MEEWGSLWNYQESIDELKQKLFYTTVELETLKVEAAEQIRKQTEDVKHLIALLKMASKERDEAKDQLNKILNKLMPCNSTELHPILAPMKANSSITESNSLSDTYNHHSHGSSPVDSFIDAVTSPDFSSMNMADSSCVNFVNKTCGQGEYNGSLLVAKIDPADAAIDILVRGKVLPEKGKLMQAVKEAGPLLRDLMIAGRLPEWKNPPPSQPLKILPVSIKGFDYNERLSANSNSVVNNPLPLAAFPDISRSCAQICSASMLSFCGSGSSSGLGSGWQLNSAVKRQRFH